MSDDISGQRFGMLTAVKFDHLNRRMQIWEFKCDCGNTTLKRLAEVKRGNTKSCGCLRRQITAERFTTHGESVNRRNSKEYDAYYSILYRCNSPSCKDYPDYGGRGIKCEFQSFDEFLDTMGRAPTPQHSVDRIDNDGNYTHGNVRWATPTQQVNNRRCSLHRKARSKSRSAG